MWETPVISRGVHKSTARCDQRELYPWEKVFGMFWGYLLSLLVWHSFFCINTSQQFGFTILGQFGAHVVHKAPPQHERQPPVLEGALRRGHGKKFNKKIAFALCNGANRFSPHHEMQLPVLEATLKGGHGKKFNKKFGFGLCNGTHRFCPHHEMQLPVLEASLKGGQRKKCTTYFLITGHKNGQLHFPTEK